MDSSDFPTYAFTDLTSGLTALKLKKSIPLIWRIKCFHLVKWDDMEISGEKICSTDFKFHPLSKDVWKLEISRESDSCGDYKYTLSMERKVLEYESAAFDFTFIWSAKTMRGCQIEKGNVHVPANARYYEIFNDEMALLGGNAYSYADIFDLVIQIESNTVARESANSVACDIEARDFQSSLNKDKLALLADVESILKEDQFADIILISEGIEIKAHKAILAARSSVFKSLLQHQMGEKASGAVDIEDIPHDTLQQLVAYLYSGRLVDLDVKSASKLFVASDKYAIEVLHGSCSRFLKNSLTVENCLETLMLADRHSNKDLRSSAVEYFSQYYKEICKKPDWRNAIKAQVNVLFELMEMLAKL